MAAPDETKSDVPTDEDEKWIEDLLQWMRKTLGENAEVEGKFADSDWTFIVKLHAMIETALNAALVKQFAAPELSRVIAKLDTSNPKTGKVAFAKALQILDPQSGVFIQKLSELRNLCVHDIRNFKFNLRAHLASLNEKDRNELLKPIMKALKPEFRATGTPYEALMAGTATVMSQLRLHDMECEHRDLQEKVYRQHSELWQRAQSKPTES
jgi:hypothetical protein